MTPQQRQRTIDFILRNQADAVIRMERLEERMEKWEDRSEEQQEKIDELIRVFHETTEKAFELVHEAAKASRDAARMAREPESRIRGLEKSQRRTTGRVDNMKDLFRMLARLEARSAKRLDQLEK